MSTQKSTRLVPGYHVRTKFIVFGDYHHTLGHLAWEHVALAMERGINIWLVYGEQMAWEHLVGEEVVDVSGSLALERRAEGRPWCTI